MNESSVARRGGARWRIGVIALLAVLYALGCGDAGDEAAPHRDGALGAEGALCAASAECDHGLGCLAGYCVAPCASAKECASGLCNPVPGSAMGWCSVPEWNVGHDPAPEMPVPQVPDVPVEPSPEEPSPEQPAPADCDGLDSLGACEGDTAIWCDDGMRRQIDCSASGQSCGWAGDDVGYFCGGEGRDPDPEPEPEPEEPEPQPEQPPPLGDCSDPLEKEVVELGNEARRQDGLGELRCDDALTRAARGHSQDMCANNYFDHTSPDGREPWDRAEEAGAQFSFAGENIAQGYESPRAVYDGWMQSPGHRANILEGGYGRIGVGLASCDGAYYWTQLFTD